jgi:hypothetical protein
MAMNEFHQDRISTEVDWLGAKLRPLCDGQAVIFSLISARGTGKRKNPIITIMPGQNVGLPATSVVVSVIDNGSCIVEIDCNSKTRMVMAGIPAKLAEVLLNKLRSTLREVKHGNSTTARGSRTKRPSSGSTGWTPPSKGCSTITRNAYRETSKRKPER